MKLRTALPLLVLVSILAVGCASVGNLSGDLKSLSATLEALRAEIGASGQLSAAERKNLTQTLDTAEAEQAEARNLLTLSAPPLDRVGTLRKSSKAKLDSVRDYLSGTN